MKEINFLKGEQVSNYLLFQEENNMIEIYTDGSSKNNGKENNCGGAGLVAFIQDTEEKPDSRIDYIWSIQENNTTNNRMELIALLKALELTQNKYKKKECVIKSDSSYCVNAFNE